MKNYKILTVGAILLLSTSAFAETKDSVNKKVEFKSNDKGGYESSATTETLTESGTTEIVKTKEKVHVASDGQVKGFVKTDTKTNPTGILNETWKQEEATNIINPDGSSKLEAVAKEVNEDGTRIDTKLKTVSEIKDNGTTQTVSKLKTTVDPKGMMNKSVVETSKTVNKNLDGTSTTLTEKKVDGKLVEKKVN